MILEIQASHCGNTLNKADFSVNRASHRALFEWREFLDANLLEASLRRPTLGRCPPLGIDGGNQGDENRKQTRFGCMPQGANNRVTARGPLFVLTKGALVNTKKSNGQNTRIEEEDAS